MTEALTPIVTDFETALNLSIEKWTEIEDELSNLYGKWDSFCGFCYYAVYLRDKAGPEGDLDKCTYCDKRISDLCDEINVFEGKYKLFHTVNKTLKVLNEIKTELKKDA